MIDKFMLFLVFILSALVYVVYEFDGWTFGCAGW